MKKGLTIFINALPILVMVGLIPIVVDDYILTILYVAVIAVSFIIKKEPKDLAIFLFGFFVMIISESIFVSTGVETFVRNSLLGMMSLWLPFLWGYSFVAMKRAIILLNL